MMKKLQEVHLGIKITKDMSKSIEIALLGKEQSVSQWVREAISEKLAREKGRK